MITSWNGTKFICCREACVLVAYPDGHFPDGAQKYSIGFGSQTPLVGPNDRITIEEAFLRMKAHIAENDKVIGRLIKAPVAQHEWDAVASLYYQSGTAALRTVASLFNGGQKREAIGRFADFRGSDGLLWRRTCEMQMALKADYGDLSKYKLYDGPPIPANLSLREFPAE